MSELEVLKDVINRLNSCKIDYMLSGSVALNYYTEPRMTRDIDIVISIKKSDLDVLFNSFVQDYYIDKDMIIDAIDNISMFNIIHLKEVIKIDFIIRKEEEYRIIEFNNKKVIKIDDFAVNIVSLEDLIISKIFWAKDSLSEMQIKDIKNLIKLSFNKDYVLSWCKKLKIIDLYNKINHE